MVLTPMMTLPLVLKVNHKVICNRVYLRSLAYISQKHAVPAYHQLSTLE